MTKKPYNTILKFFLFAFALMMLSACGGGGGGGDTAAKECDPATHFCETTKAARKDCVSATTDCRTGLPLPRCTATITTNCFGGFAEPVIPPVGDTITGDDDGVADNEEGNICDANPTLPQCQAAVDDRDLIIPAPPTTGDGPDTAIPVPPVTPVTPTCDDSLNFCDAPDQALRADCNIATHNCVTGLAIPCLDPDANEVACHVTRATYTPTDPIPNNPTTGNPFASWTDALTHYQSAEYQRGGGADQHGVAYAHARGYTGENIIVSIIGGPIDRTHPEFAGQLVQGYDAGASGDARTAENAGTCDTSTCLSPFGNSFAAGIIAGKSGNFDEGGEIQGIAYNAKMKPVSIPNGFRSDTQTQDAIVAASGADITAMNITGTWSRIKGDSFNRKC